MGARTKYFGSGPICRFTATSYCGPIQSLQQSSGRGIDSTTFRKTAQQPHMLSQLEILI